MNTPDTNDKPSLRLTDSAGIDQISEAYDAQLSPLLDEALASPARHELPAGLVDRIMLQTRSRLPQAQRMARRLALSIGPIWFRRVHAVAAGIVLASTAALLLVASGILRDAHDTVTAKEDIAQLGQYGGFEAPIDQDIHQLAMHIDAAAASGYSYSEADALRTVEALESLLNKSPAASPTRDGDAIDQLF